jgi:acetolactate synthase-1/2/3 large subunit
VTKREEVDEAIAWARSIKGPTVIEFRVEMEDAVYPMVPAGAALDQMIQRPMKA